MMVPWMPVDDFGTALAQYSARWPEEVTTAALFADLWREDGQFGANSMPWLRAREEGHFTGSAWLVDRSGRKVLLTHHRKLDRWLQLGGHADGEQDLSAVALKEAQEESGLSNLRVDPDIFDLDRHWIPERADVPGHWHYDVRHVVHAGANENFVVSDESHALAWRDIAELAADPDADGSMRRMAAKWMGRRP